MKSIIPIILFLIIFSSFGYAIFERNLYTTNYIVSGNYCKQGQNCTLNNLNVTGTTTMINATVINYDVTGPVNAYSYSLNGTDLFDTFVPYTGATSNVNLGSKSLTANELTGGDVVINDHTITTSDSGDLYIDQILTRFTLDEGITIGVNNNFGFSVDTYDAFIKQLTADKDFYLQYNDGGVTKTALYVDGSEGEITIGGSSPISGRDVTINGDLDTGENTYYGDSIHITPEAPQNIPAFLMGEWDTSIPFGFNYPGTLQIISNNSIYFSAYHPPSGLQFLFGNSIENLSFFGSYTDHPTEIRTGNQERIHLRDSSGDNEILLGGNAKYLPDTDFLTLYKSNNGGYGPNIKFINPNTGDNSGSKLEWRISTSTIARASMNIYRTAGYLMHMDFYTGSNGLTLALDDQNQVGIGIQDPKVKLDVSGNTHISKNLTVDGNITGNFFYTGMLNHSESGISIPITVANTWFNFTNLMCAESNGFSCDGNKTIALVDGLFNVEGEATGVGGTNHLYHLNILVNGENTPYMTEGHGKLNNAADILTLTTIGQVRLNKGDEVKLAIRDSTGTSTGTVYSSGLFLEYIGN